MDFLVHYAISYVCRFLFLLSRELVFDQKKCETVHVIIEPGADYFLSLRKYIVF